MASKKRKPGKTTRKQSKGLSGNPQRRARQAPAGRQRAETRPLAPAPPRTWPWWADSHERVLTRVRDTEWPSRLLDIETLAGQIAGEEFHARVNAPGPGTGLAPADWLAELTVRAMTAIDADQAADGKEWPRLLAFCRGVADEDPADGDGSVAWYRPAGGEDVLLARDVYGDRFLLAAPFTDPERPGATDHWYAWDLDWCGLGIVVGGSVHDDCDGALAEWRSVVGPAAGTAGFEPCRPEMAIRLLGEALEDSSQSGAVIGDEPVEYFREFSRLRRRAAALAGSLRGRHPGQRSADLAAARHAAAEDFLAQYADRAWNSPDDRGHTENLLDLILSEWGPPAPPDERAFFACSPHRIETCAVILRDMYEPGPVGQALAMLPAWVGWCARRAGLGEEFAERALEAARVEAATPAASRAPRREPPFRRPE